jgi:ADP-ribose pyrophosphatase
MIRDLQIILDEYFNLIQQYPSLIKPNDAPLKIITDRKIIEKWQESNKEKEIGVLLQDKYITIIRDLVEFPDGSMAGYNRIINTASFNKGSVGSVILPVKDRKILLIKIFRHPTRQWSLEIPRGFGESNLTPEEIARKEIKEEIGGEIEKVVDLGEFYNNTGLEGNNVHIYLAYLGNVGKPRNAEGIEEIIWVSLKKMEDMIAKSEISDGFTIVAYTRAKLNNLI